MDRPFECECGRRFATRGWLRRHRAKCAVYQALPLMELMKGVMVRVTPKLVADLTEHNALFARLAEKK